MNKIIFYIESNLLSPLHWSHILVPFLPWHTLDKWYPDHPRVTVYHDNAFPMYQTFTWMNPLPTMEPLQMLQMKHSLCQARLSNATNLVLPSPPLPEADMLMMSIQNKHFAWLSSDVCFYRLLCTALTLSADHPCWLTDIKFECEWIESINLIAC